MSINEIQVFQIVKHINPLKRMRQKSVVNEKKI